MARLYAGDSFNGARRGEKAAEFQSLTSSLSSGISRGHSWSGTLPPPPDWYLKVTLQDVGEELKLLRDMEVYSLEELRAMRNQLIEILDQALSE